MAKNPESRSLTRIAGKPTTPLEIDVRCSGKQMPTGDRFKIFGFKLERRFGRVIRSNDGLTDCGELKAVPQNQK